MFESIVLRNSKQTGNVTSGAIAEALLFYQNTRIFIGHGSLVGLAKSGDLGLVISLINENRLQATHTEQILATANNTYSSCVAYDFGAFTTLGHGQTVGNDRSERVEISLRQVGLSNRHARKMAQAFVDAVPLRDLTSDHFVPGGITNAAREDVNDPIILNKLIRVGLSTIVGGYEIGSELKVDSIKSDLGHFIFTNIDFNKINIARKKSSLDPINLGHLLNLIHEARADLHIAAFYGGDFPTTRENSALVKWHQKHLLDRTEKNTDEIENFQEYVLTDYPNIRDAIDSGNKTFSDFIKILDKSKRFKNWTSRTTVDSKYISQYIESATADTWAEKAPTKVIRYLASLISGVFDPTAGIVSGAADTFLVDKIAQGWRPNHFIDGSLKPFLRQN